MMRQEPDATKGQSQTSALELLLDEKTYETLLRFARLQAGRVGLSTAEAHDAVQDVAIALSKKPWADRLSESPEASFRYLMVALRNRLVSEARRQRRETALAESLPEVEDPSPSPLEQVIGKDQEESLSKALARLPGNDRDLLEYWIRAYRERGRPPTLQMLWNFFGEEEGDERQMYLRFQKARLALGASLLEKEGGAA